ncbi:neurotrimin-like isoform X2, partial [Vespula maculifrons]
MLFLQVITENSNWQFLVMCDVNIIGPLIDFDKLYCNRACSNESVHHRRGFRRSTSMSIYLIFNQLHIIHPQFRPKSRTSVLEPSQNFLSIVVRARSKEETICPRGPHKSWLKRATIRLLSYFRRNSDDVTFRLPSHIARRTRKEFL